MTIINPKVAGFESKERIVARKIKSVNVMIINPKVAGFESKERLHSSEIKEDGLRFVLRR